MRWMTYREIAETRGIDLASARTLVRRNRWERRRVGDGTALMQVLVPGDKVTARDRPRAALRDEIAALRRQVAHLSERLEGR